MLAILILAALGAVPPPPAAPAPAPGEISVVGDAEVKFVPNQASVQLTIAVTEKDLPAAKRNNDERARRLLVALAAAGVEPRHIQTGEATVNPQYKYSDNDSRLVGFTATKVFNVCIDDLARVDEVTTAGLRAGVTTVGNVQLKSTEQRKYEDQARVEAAKSARARATAMVEALGGKLGRARQVIEEPAYVLPGSTSAYSATGGQGATATSFAAGELTVLAKVQVKFDID